MEAPTQDTLQLELHAPIPSFTDGGITARPLASEEFPAWHIQHAQKGLRMGLHIEWAGPETKWAVYTGRSDKEAFDLVLSKRPDWNRWEGDVMVRSHARYAYRYIPRDNWTPIIQAFCRQFAAAGIPFSEGFAMSMEEWDALAVLTG